ncbi:MAG: class I SAM-dependent methyltransferase [Solirubrobacterales bacterium]
MKAGTASERSIGAVPAFRAARRLGLLRRRNPPPPSCEARLKGGIHSLRRDQEAITHHYDVSNEFYRRMLGETMVYSCAYFGSPDDTLDQAQTRKLDLICRKLELREGDRLLDIGCGWGSLMIFAAHHYGVQAVGVTLSEAQAELARERIREAGVQDRCEVRIQDYREINDGPYDKISSVGMFEHVGEENLQLYFEQVLGLLAPDGLFLNHGIVRTAPQPMDPNSFTIRYVFPDGFLHTIGAVITEMEAAGFEILDDESLRREWMPPLSLASQEGGGGFLRRRRPRRRAARKAGTASERSSGAARHCSVRSSARSRLPSTSTTSSSPATQAREMPSSPGSRIIRTSASGVVKRRVGAVGSLVVGGRTLPSQNSSATGRPTLERASSRPTSSASTPATPPGSREGA